MIPPLEDENKSEQIVERAAKIFFLSFKYSQGDGNLQSKLFKYIRLKFPELASQLVKIPKEELTKVSRERTVKFASSDKHFSSSEDVIDYVYSSEISAFYDSLSSPVSGNSLLAEILEGMIERDVLFSDGRPNGKIQSYLVVYGQEQTPTGDKVFNQLFREITELIPKLDQNNFLFFEEVKAKHIKANTGEHRPSH